MQNNNLITYRTQDDVDAAVAQILSGLNTLEHLIGCYNYSDRNRVGAFVAQLRDLLARYGYSSEVIGKADWTSKTIASPEINAQYLADITSIKNAFYGTTPLPTSMDNLNFEDANNIERLLEEISQYIDWMIASFHYSNQFYSGEYVEIADISFLQRRTMGELEPYTMAELSQLTMNQLMYGW